jgi:hypothetical protein
MDALDSSEIDYVKYRDIFYNKKYEYNSVRSSYFITKLFELPLEYKSNLVLTFPHKLIDTCYYEKFYEWVQKMYSYGFKKSDIIEFIAYYHNWIYYTERPVFEYEMDGESLCSYVTHVKKYMNKYLSPDACIKCNHNNYIELSAFIDSLNALIELKYLPNNSFPLLNNENLDKLSDLKLKYEEHLWNDESVEHEDENSDNGKYDDYEDKCYENSL